MINFNIDDSGIFVVKYSGNVFCNNILKTIDKFGNLKYLDENLRILHDMRDCELKVTVEDLNKIKKRTREVSERFNSFKTAYVVTKPYNTAISYLLLNMINIRKAHRKSFYTIEAAKNWLKTISNKEGAYIDRL